MKKKNKKGFTLIELLPVIVILAVIALIAVPQVLKILNKARLSAAEGTVYGIVKSAETYVSNFMLKNRGSISSESLVFDSSSDGCLLENISSFDSYELEGLEKLEFKGTKPKNGKVIISNSGTSIVTTNLNISDFNCNYTGNIATCEKSESGTNQTPSVIGTTSEPPNGNGYTGVKAIVYLDPTDLTKNCDATNSNSTIETKTECMKWYAYADDGTNYMMILDYNTTAGVAWNLSGDNSSIGEVITHLASDTTGWNSSLNPRLISYDEIGEDKTSFNGYAWLYDRTHKNCIVNGCLNNSIGDESTYGYWTSTPFPSDSVNHAWVVHNNGQLNHDYVAYATGFGVRPVITVSKNKIS